MELDDAIGQVSQLYRTVTGREMPASEAPYAPIPPEKDPVQHVQEQMDRLLGLLGGPAPATNGGGTQASARGAQWVPPLTTYETANEVVFAVDAPGATRDRVDVRLEAGMLVVSGQRSPPLAEGQTMRHTEVRFGAFRRVVPLPPGLRTADMTARLEGGVLEVRIPRDGAGGVRHIDVS